MNESVPTQARPRCGLFAFGVTLGLVATLALGEFFVRLRMPTDLLPYLGAASTLTGIYKPDPQLRMDYRSFAEFRALNPELFDQFGPLDATPRTWVVLGPSFAGALGVAMRAQMPDHRIYPYIRDMSGVGKDRFHQWVAQARLLLAQGLRPERIFVVLIPQEVSRYSELPLAWCGVSAGGAMTLGYRRPAGPIGALLDVSRMGLLAWTRSTFRKPTYAKRTKYITENMPDEVVSDFRRMFGVLGETSRRYRVPVTLVLLPDHGQILRPSNFALQRSLVPLAQAAGLDVFDFAPAVLAQPDKSVLYQSDSHYTERGDALLLSELRAHLVRSP
ncbi:MAG: hypothetical protein AABY95_05400 [Pseudomonadota bacterium]